LPILVVLVTARLASSSTLLYVSSYVVSRAEITTWVVLQAAVFSRGERILIF